VQAIVADHGGKIDVKSKLNQGTSFKITFPKTADHHKKTAKSN